VSSRALTIALLCGIGALALALDLAARLDRRLPTMGVLAAHLSRRRPVRILLFAVWAWSGWHFFAR
jgi:hypothetical protein